MIKFDGKRNMLFFIFFLFSFYYEKGSELNKNKSLKEELQIKFEKMFFDNSDFNTSEEYSEKINQGFYIKNDMYKVNGEALKIDANFKNELNLPYSQAQKIKMLYYGEFFLMSAILPFIIFYYFPLKLLPKFQTLVPTLSFATLNTFLLKTPFQKKKFKINRFSFENEICMGIPLKHGNININNEFTYCGYINNSEFFNENNARQTVVHHLVKKVLLFPSQFPVIQYLLFKKGPEDKVFYYVPCWNAYNKNNLSFYKHPMQNFIDTNPTYEHELKDIITHEQDNKKLFDISKVKTTKEALLYAATFNFNLFDKYWKKIFYIEQGFLTYLEFGIKSIGNIPGRILWKIGNYLFFS